MDNGIAASLHRHVPYSRLSGNRRHPPHSEKDFRKAPHRGQQQRHQWVVPSRSGCVSFLRMLNKAVNHRPMACPSWVLSGILIAYAAPDLRGQGVFPAADPSIV